LKEVTLVKYGPANLDLSSTEVPPVNPTNSLRLGNSPRDGRCAMSKTERSIDSVPKRPVFGNEFSIAGIAGGDREARHVWEFTEFVRPASGNNFLNSISLDRNQANGFNCTVSILGDQGFRDAVFTEYRSTRIRISEVASLQHHCLHWIDCSAILARWSCQ
jgi:hypothetical protein